jgi:hypothetical protein
MDVQNLLKKAFNQKKVKFDEVFFLNFVMIL